MKEKNKYLFILCGEAFSGKSTVSKKLSEMYEAKIIGRDKIYFALDNILALENTSDEDDNNLWKNLWPISIQGIKNQLFLGHSVVVDDNCLYLKQREELRSLAKEMGVKNILIYLNVSAKTLKERIEQNKINKDRHEVPSSWLAEDSKLFERPTENENPIIYTENDTPDKLFEKFNSFL